MKHIRRAFFGDNCGSVNLRIGLTKLRELTCIRLIKRNQQFVEQTARFKI